MHHIRKPTASTTTTTATTTTIPPFFRRNKSNVEAPWAQNLHAQSHFGVLRDAEEFVGVGNG